MTLKRKLLALMLAGAFVALAEPAAAQEAATPPTQTGRSRVLRQV